MRERRRAAQPLALAVLCAGFVCGTLAPAVEATAVVDRGRSGDEEVILKGRTRDGLEVLRWGVVIDAPSGTGLCVDPWIGGASTGGNPGVCIGDDGARRRLSSREVSFDSAIRADLNGMRFVVGIGPARMAKLRFEMVQGSMITLKTGGKKLGHGVIFFGGPLGTPDRIRKVSALNAHGNEIGFVANVGVAPFQTQFDYQSDRIAVPRR